MDFSLVQLGKIAGLGGIAIGVVAILIRPIISATLSVPASQRAPTLRFVAFGAFFVGALGIITWLISGMQGNSSVNAYQGGVAAGRDITGTVSMTGTSPTGPVQKLP